MILDPSQLVLNEDSPVLMNRGPCDLHMGRLVLTSSASMQAELKFLAVLSDGLTKLPGNPNGCKSNFYKGRLHCKHNFLVYLLMMHKGGPREPPSLIAVTRGLEQMYHLTSQFFFSQTLDEK